MVPDFAFCSICPTVIYLLGSAFPKPCRAAVWQLFLLSGALQSGHFFILADASAGLFFAREEVVSMAKKYNTPHREHVIKTRLDDEEYDSFIRQCETYEISQSEMIRKAIFGMEIHPVIKVNAVSPELLDVFNELIRQIVKVGTNLNQIAHRLNAGGSASDSAFKEIRKCSGELTDLKYEILKKAGDAIGHDQTYRL